MASQLHNHPHSTAQVAGHPLHPMLIPFPIAFFVGTLVSDIVFAIDGDPFWARMSVYLICAGLVMAALGRLPAAGESVEYAGARFTVERMDGRRIAVVRARAIPERGQHTTA